jgi:hypothetical protein
MSESLILFFAVGLAGMLWLGLRPKQPRRNRRPVAAPPPADGGNTLATLQRLQANGSFWGVSISHAGCAESRRLMSQQYSFGDAPRLPLANCSAQQCTCQYSGLKHRRGNSTRRTRQDRRAEIRFDKERPERRNNKARRRGEKWEDHTF